ncbi:DUF5994 family protein [Pimelobacter simplex]|uniref:DUF5994 family protein n=1 Tax=Nocardioides simplex TaxID=2045 RepID=UPI00382A3284
MAASVPPVPGLRSASRVPLRIRLDNGFPSGPLDGAWWPQSRDLQVECADLVDHLPGLVGLPSRLLFSRPDWDAVAEGASERTITASRGAVAVGSFPTDDTHLLVVVTSSGERLHLLVIPSTTETDVAEDLMRRAADERNARSATALLETARSHFGGVVPFEMSMWENDGGAGSRGLS